MKRLVASFLLLLAASTAYAAPSRTPLNVGVLALRPEVQIAAQWQPLAAYLESTLAQPVELRLYDHAGLDAAVAQRAVDVVVTSPGHFVLLRETTGLSAALATVVSRVDGHALSAYGGVIVALADRADIASLRDLAGKRIAAISLESFAGYQAQAFELLEAGVPLPTGDRLRFTKLPHDRVIDEVLAGRADAGFVRSGVVESLAREGKLDPARLKIINRQNLPALPDAVSTRLYPEWPVAVMPQIDKRLASRIAAALLSMPHGSLGEGAEVYGFEIPANYGGIEELLRRLRLPPFERTPQITPADLWDRYAPWIMALAGLLLLLAGASVGLIVLYRRAHRSASAVTVLNAALEDERRLFIGGPNVAFKWRAAEGWPVEYVSPNVKEQFGYASEDFTSGKVAYLSVIHPDDLARVAAEVTAHSEAGVPYFEQEYRIRRADGEYRWIYDFTAVVREAAGRIAYYHGYLSDITERKLAEEALRDSRQRLDNIVANSPAATYRCAHDPHWTMEFISAGITRISGYPAEEFVNNRVRSYASIIHPEDRQRVADAVAAGLARKGSYEMDYRLLAADGGLRWVHEQGRGVFAPDGRLLCLDGVIFDITAQREAEEALKLNAERMEALLQLNQMTGASRDELMRFAFEAAVRLTRSKLGYLALMNEDETVLSMQPWSQEAMAECKGPGMPKIYPVETTGLWREAVRQRRPIITNDYAAPNLWKSGMPEGHVKLIRHMNLPVIVGGRIVLVAGVGNKDEDYNETDVQQLTLLMEGMWRLIERKQAEEELTRYRESLEEKVQQRTAELMSARDAAEAANRAKSIFLANMSHELRTPLNAILGFAELMERDTALHENHRRNLATINRSGRHLLSLINDILEISKMEAGRLGLQIGACNLRELVEIVMAAIEMRARQAGLELTLSLEENVPRFISTDVGKLRQVLTNLLSNAVKYTLQGSVRLEVGATEMEGAGRVMLQFVVRDTGVGIPAPELESIFQPFYQTEHGVRLGEGTGLGLTISRQYAHLLGGELTVSSEVNQGSVFTLHLPVAVAETAEPLPQRRRVLGLAEGQAPRRILIVEDKEDNQRLLEQVMAQAGLETRVASNGAEAVTAFEAWHPDLIWMDMRMPVMNGYEATRRIRALPGGDKVKIAALTASVFREDRGAILDAGCDDALDKPLDEAGLFAAMERLLGLRFRYAEAPEAETAKAAAPLDLMRLPAEVREALRNSARSLDIEEIARAIERVRETDAIAADRLEAMARAYQYDRILTLCEPSEDSHERG